MNSFQKIINLIGKKNNGPNLSHFYATKDLNNPHWVSMAVNKNIFRGTTLTKELEILTNKNGYHLKIAQTKEGFFHQLWINKVDTWRGLLSVENSQHEKFNSLTTALIEKEIFYFQQKLNQDTHHSTPPETKDVMNGEKALEWIKASNKLLEAAVIESLTNPERLFQLLLFFGKNPKSLQHEFRVILFNLDMLFILQDENKLRIKIYNDKDLAYGSEKKASLEGDFIFRRRELFDELTKLLSILSAGIKIH